MRSSKRRAAFDQRNPRGEIPGGLFLVEMELDKIRLKYTYK